MITPLTDLQLAVSRRVLAEEEARRRHLVIALSGAHAYGFPSPDSDLDLKAIHIAPTARVLGLGSPRETADRLEVIDGVEIDYTSNELRAALRGMLRGNGNFLERVLGPLPLVAAPELVELRPLIQRSLSRNVYGHYHGFARSQLLQAKAAEAPTAKKILYVLRTALTGAHLLRTGRVVTDLGRLLRPFGFEAAAELIETKLRGERTALAAAQAERWFGEVDRAFAALADARERSPLPEAPPNQAELESWLIEIRRRDLG